MRARRSNGTGDRDTSGCREAATTLGERGVYDDALERGSDDAYMEVDRAHVLMYVHHYTRSDPVSIPKRVLRYFVYVPVTTNNTNTYMV